MFKSYGVIFDQDGYCYGIGENLSYARIEDGMQYRSNLRNVALYSSQVSKFLTFVKGIPEEKLKEVDLDFRIVPSTFENIPFYCMINGLNFPLGVVFNWKAIYQRIITGMYEAEIFDLVYQENLKENIDFITQYDNLKSDKGVVGLKLSNRWYITLHKKIFDYVKSDDIFVDIRESKDPTVNYFYAVFHRCKAGKYHVKTYIRVLKVV